VEFERDCANFDSQLIDPTLVWIDETEPPKAIKDRLWRGCRYSRYKSPSDALSFLRSRPDIKAIVSLAVRTDDCYGVLGYLRDLFLLNEVEDAVRIEVLLRLIGNVPHGLITKFRSLGAEIRWALDPKDTAECLEYLRHRLLYSSERNVRLELTYPDPSEPRIVLCGPRGRAEYQIGDRLKRTVEVLEEHRKGIGTKQFAEELGVNLKTPKKYMRELRGEHDRIRLTVGETTPGERVFVSKRLPGGWVYKLAAEINK